MGCLEILVGILGLLAFVSANTQLLFANRRDVRLINVPAFNDTQSSSLTVVGGLADAAAVDFLYSEHTVFWTDVSLEAIKRTFYNESGIVEDIITRGLVAPDGLACDWIGKKLYWTDSETNRIEVSELDGSSRTVLFWEDLHLPRAIALDPNNGYIYWTDWGDNPKIERAGMNGMDREIIVDDNVYWPNGLTIDYSDSKIYWVDAKYSLVMSANMDGSHKKIVLDGELKHPFAITVHGDWLYWTDWQTTSIHSCNKTSGQQRWVVLQELYSPMDIHAFMPDRQPLTTVNPCGDDNGGCSHLCLLAPRGKGYSCACPTGVRLLSDGFTCANSAQEMLILARRKDIRRISLDTPDHTAITIPLDNIQHAIAVDYDPVDGFIYWTDGDVRAIRRSKLDGSESEYIITNDIQHPDGIAIDWVARNLYWTDTGTDRIEVSRLNGTSRKMLLAEYLDEPRAIAVDPINGYMYWTDWGIVSKIERANLDGTNRTVLVNTSLSWPNGIAVDFGTQRIYWGDGMEDKIEVVNADGTNRRVLVEDEIPHIFGFTMLGEYIYWTDWQKRTIERVNKETGQDRTVIIESLAELMGLKAISMERIPGTNPCGNNNGGCSHLCLYRPHGHICYCPMGLELLADGKNCIVPEAFLLFLKPDDIRRISLETTFKDVEIPLNGIEKATALDFDILDNRIYWADSSVKKISRAFMNGTQREDVIEFGLMIPEGLAVDWLAHNIYFSDINSHRIEVARLDGSSRKVLLWKDLDTPRSIALDPMEGYMYWCEWRGDPIIRRAFMDGTNPEVIYRGVPASGLTIDYEERRLYWASHDTNSVESVNLIGGDHHRLIEDESHPFGLTQFRDFVYWSDWSGQTIERCNKTSGANRTTIQGGLDYVMDILVFHPSRQSGWNPCSLDNGGCDQLCLSRPNVTSSNDWDFTCGCSTHYTLNPDNKTCSPPESFLLFSQRNSVKRITFDFDESPDVVLPIHGVRNIRRIAYDYDEKRVYWIDSRTKEIKRSEDNGVDMETFIHNPNGHTPFDPLDMAIDPYSRLVFWTCDNQTSINVSRLDGTPVGLVISANDQKPRLLALMPEKGLMFWTNHRHTPKLECAELDGTNQRVIREKGLGRPRTLTADYSSERIYWFSPELSEQIMSVTIDGEDTKIFKVDRISPVGLAVMGSYLYWADKRGDAVFQVDKLTGKNQAMVKGKMDSLSDVLAVDGNLIPYHPCLDNNECSHLCIITKGGGKRCSCPLTLVLDEDERTCVEPPTCSPTEFTCLSGNILCIPIEWRCDKLAECGDESDEMDCVECREGQFKCPGSQCIDQSLWCDGKPDCIYGNSDEEQCPPCSNPRWFHCDNGQCITQHDAECDGTRDCNDGSDELHCDVSPSEVPSYNPQSGHQMNSALVGTLVAASSLAIMIIGIFFLCRRWGIGQARGQEDYSMPPDQNNFSHVLMLNQLDKNHLPHKYLSNPNRQPKTTNLNSCSAKVSPKSGSGESSVGLFERNPPVGASSCSSGVVSSTGTSNYPKETLNPPPSPVTDRSQCTTEIYYSPAQNPSTSNSRSYKHHKLRYIPPPPTPCSTDVCEDSEPYCISAATAMPQHKYTNISKSRRKKGKYSHSNILDPEAVNYDSEPYPPPPTPHSQYLSDNYDSCPPSPSTERSFFNPYPPPPSPATDST